MVRRECRVHARPTLTPRRAREQLRVEPARTVLAGGSLVDEALTLELAFDQSEHVRILTESDLAALGWSEDDAHRRAIANLQQRSAGRWNQLMPGLWQSPWADYFDGARLALIPLVHPLPVRGKPIAVVPNRCALLVTGTEEPAALAMLYQVATRLAEDDRPVHLSPLVLDGGRWRKLTEEDLAALVPSLLSLASLQAVLDVDTCIAFVRGRLLAQGFTRIGELGVMEGGGNIALAVVECPSGERVAVPKADVVVFPGQGVVAWYKLQAMLGPALAPLDVWSPYYELRRAPTPPRSPRCGSPRARADRSACARDHADPARSRASVRIRAFTGFCSRNRARRSGSGIRSARSASAVLAVAIARRTPATAPAASYASAAASRSDSSSPPPRVSTSARPASATAHASSSRSFARSASISATSAGCDNAGVMARTARASLA